MIKDLYYIYPKYQLGSFHNISVEHISRLRKHIKIQEIDENTLDNAIWAEGKKALLHPIGYILLGDRKEKFQFKLKRLEKLSRVCNRLGGFDTADSSRISDIFVKVLNQMDLVFVPSSWAREVYRKSGVETEVKLLPHGVPNEFLKPSVRGEYLLNPALNEVAELKNKHRARLILFFLMHSGYRKGADLVAKAVKEIQEKRNNVYLVVKTHNVLDPFFAYFKDLKMINIRGWFNEIELRQLYDLCDIVVCPSRGGGFELNALEGIARGKPTLVTDAMCFKDYIDYCIPIRVEKEVRVLPGNPIHVGMGYEVSISDFVSKLDRVLKYYRRYRKRAERASNKIKKIYNWDKIVEDLYQTLIDDGFI